MFKPLNFTMVSVAVLFTLLGCLSGTHASFSPTRISFENMLEKKNIAEILDSLSNIGMISVTNIPSFRKLETLDSLLKCIDKSSAAAEHVFDDGTVRRTLATHSILGEMHEVVHGSYDATCDTFDEVSKAFRKSVEAVTDAFATSLQTLTDCLPEDQPLLKSTAKGKNYPDIASISRNGEHLEHFHCYHAVSNQKIKDTAMNTIDWHIDQGLFLVFTPGLIDSKTSDGFYIQLQDGTQEMVQFDELDDLIILLGDGVNQILNPLLKKHGLEPLRVTPHSLIMPQDTSSTEARVWYGRIVLPPSDALHPYFAATAYGELRQQMINSPEDSHALGCSSSSMEARHLETVDCEPDSQFFCWHRCFNLTEDLNAATCEAQGLDLACINDQRQLWSGAHDPVFEPGCVDLDTAEVAPKQNGDDDHEGNHTDGGGRGTPTTAPTPTSSSYSLTMSVEAFLATLVACVSPMFG